MSTSPFVFGVAMTDVVLINPPLTRMSGPLKEHLGLGYLTAALRRAGLTVRLIDAPASRLNFPALRNELLAEEFQVLGISVVFQDSLRPVLDWLESGLNLARIQERQARLQGGAQVQWWRALYQRPAAVGARA